MITAAGFMLGAMLTVLAVPMVAVESAGGRGGTLVVVARRSP
jgi:hypothetical protein